MTMTTAKIMAAAGTEKDAISILSPTRNITVERMSMKNRTCPAFAFPAYLASMYSLKQGTRAHHGLICDFLKSKKSPVMYKSPRIL